MDMSLSSKLAIVAATAGTFFALGAFYQHHHVLRNIGKLERQNAQAYFIRSKLYALLDIFEVKAISASYDDFDESDSHKMGAIMKYGFPSMNEISVNEAFNFVISFDRRNSAVQWMCERVDACSYTNAFDRQNLALSVHRQTLPGITYQPSEASRVFFMSNIKPFLNRGFNTNVWGRLLHYVHDMANKYGIVFVYTGSIYLPRKKENNVWKLDFQRVDNAIVAIPTHFFKIVIIDPKEVDNAPYAEAYVVTNADISDETELRSLLCDVRDIENTTGLKFFEGFFRNFVNTQLCRNMPNGTESILSEII